MRDRGFVFSIVVIILAMSASSLGAAGHYRVLNGPARFYYGHISYTEAKLDGQDPVVLREGQAVAEPAVLNLPLGPGDTIRTTADRRCEIQFDTGTIVRLDFETELKIETVLAQSLSAATQLSNLALNRGWVYVMYKQYDSREMFQVLTPLAALKLNHNTVAMVRAAENGSTEAQVKSGKASVMFGPNEKSLEKQVLKSRERLTLASAVKFERGAYLGGSDFENWNDDINARFEELHKGESALPKPVQNLPPAVFYFAQRYGNSYGEWLWNDLYGYVWRPFLNRLEYPWGWQPYYYGRWSSLDGQLYWVPEEAWGWIPYHLGVWQWDKKLGWVWLPGSLFAPAWVDWEFFFGDFGWRPYGLFDWFAGFSTGFFYDGGAWNYFIPGDPGSIPVPGAGAKPGLTTVRRGQLQQPPSLTMSPELKSAFKNLVAAYKRGDPRVLESLRRLTSETVFVSRANLNSSRIQEKIMTWEKLPKPGAPAPSKDATGAIRKPFDVRTSAALAFRASLAARQIFHQAVNPGPVPKPAALPSGARPAASASDVAGRQPAGSAAVKDLAARTSGPAGRPRFLDWNPDVKVARGLGVRIEYASRTNEVRCPELGLSSRDRASARDGFASRMTSSGVVREPASFVGSSVLSGGSSASSSPSAVRGAGAAQGTATSGGQSGGKIKN